MSTDATSLGLAILVVPALFVAAWVVYVVWQRLSGPQHCMICGDEFIKATYRDGYRTSDGSPIIQSWRKCPRNDDLKPDVFDRWQPGRCSGLSPFACAVQRAAYRDHRPSWRACAHVTVSETGDECHAKDGKPITLGGRLVPA